MDDECNAAVELMGTLPARANSGVSYKQSVLAVHSAQITSPQNKSQPSETCPTLDRDASRVLASHTKQDPISGDVAPAIGGHTADTLTVTYATKWGLEDQHINSGAGLFQPTATGRPRRLTPLECERLMSWPDQWTLTGQKEDGTVFTLSDTARYRLCGNGVGSVCAEWIARRLHDALQRQEDA